MPIDASTASHQFRCWRCSRIQAVLVDFRGQIERRCRSCTAFAVWTGDPEHDLKLSQAHTANECGWMPGRAGTLRCDGCSSVLAVIDVVSGRAEIKCARCKWLTVTRPLRFREEPRALLPDELMALMEERWQTLIKEYNRRRSAVAVGLRFDVFMRDGFRCRYCGASADDGAILHADHVTPQSKGGPTMLDNLVTACFDCNLGKSNKLLEDGSPVF